MPSLCVNYCLNDTNKRLGLVSQSLGHVSRSLGHNDESSSHDNEGLGHVSQSLGHNNEGSGHDNGRLGHNNQLLGDANKGSGHNDEDLEHSNLGLEDINDKMVAMKFFYGFILFLAVFNNATAQLAERDTARWGYSLATSGMLITGNVERFLWTSTGELRHVQPVWGFITTNTYQYGTIFNNKTEDDIISKNFIYLHPKKRWYPYQMTWLERNWRRKIDHRYQIGLGSTWIAIRKSKHILKLSLTGTYESTNFRGDQFENYPDGETNTINTWRATMRIFGNNVIGKSNLRLRYEAWVQPSVEDADNFRYHLEGVVSLPVGARFSLQSAVNHSFEHVVLEGVRQRDLIWTFGVSFQSF